MIFEQLTLTASQTTTRKKLFTWGLNTSGQLGYVGAASSFAQISSGPSHAIAIDSTGKLWGWGLNTSGQVGDNTAVTKSSPVLISSTANWKTVSAGTDFSIALNTLGQLYAWGLNANYTLGTTDNVNRSSPTQIGLSSWTVASAGASHTMAITSTGGLWGWGATGYGQIGQINGSTIAYSWTQISSNVSHTVGLRSDGKLFTWGLNSSGQLGTGDTLNRSSPVQINSVNYNQVSAGLNYTLALTSSNQLFAWGVNNVYQLGLGNTITQSSPVQVNTVSYSQISAGLDHALAIDAATNSLWTWGNSSTLPLLYILNTNIYSWTQISTNGTYTLAIRSDSTLWAWGLNSSGQLGVSNTTNYSSPVQVGTSSWTQVVAGSANSLGITVLGRLYAWGNNATGQLGQNNTTNTNSPVQIGTYSYNQIGAGNSFAVAKRVDGTVWTWGLNANNQLGTGTTINLSSPVQVAGAVSWASVSAGYDHIVAVDVSYNIWAWGNSASISVAPYYSWSQVATGGSHIVAVRNDGKLFAWGLNNVGQLGDGTTVNKSSPVQVGTNILGTSWTQVFAGDSHSVAIASNNLLYSWGLNNNGQLGIGNTTNQSVPIVVAGTTTPVDNSINAYALTNVGVTYMTTNSPFASPGATGYSQYFDGSSGYITLPSAFNTAMVGLAGSQWTMECWVYITAFNSSNSYGTTIFGTYQGVAANGRWIFSYIGSAGITGTCGFEYTTGTGSQVNLQGNYTFNLNTWTHLAVTIDATTSSASTIVIYVNGVGQTFTNNNLSTQTNNYAVPTIGGNTQYSNNTLGYVSNLRLVKGNIVYVGNFTPPTSPLTAIQSIGGTNISAITTGQTLLLTEQTISNLASWNQVGAGVSYTLARRSDNLLFSWGTNSVYQLGLGTTISQSSPIQVGVNSWTQISAGYDHALAIDSSTRNIWTWGNVASTFNLSAPYSWTQVSEGLSHTLAIRSDSTLWAWGSNSYGQVGSGNTISYSSPIQIGSPASWSQIFAGDLHSTGIATNNLLYTWGYNAVGQLGTGDTSNRLLPTPVTGTGVLTDASSNAFSLTKIGTTYTVQQIAPFSGTNSQYFDGASGTISIPNSTAIILNTGAVPTFTIELWFNSNTLSNNLIDKGSQAGVSIPCYRISCGTSISFLWGPGSGATYSTYTTSGITINPNTWYHVAVVSNAGVLNIYVNGVSYATGTLPSYGDNGDPLFIGSRYAGDQFYQGYISNLRIVKGTAVYTGNFTVPTSPLTVTQSAGTNISAITAGQTSLLTLQQFPGTTQSWSQVSAGTSFTLALRDNKTLWGWGLNSSSQLGTGDTSVRALPVPITGTSIPTDASTNSFGLVKVGATYPNTIYSPFVTPGTTGYSQYFDGSTGYLTIPATSAFNLAATDFTLECWVYVTASGNNTILTLGTGGSATYFELQINSSGTITVATNTLATWAWPNVYNTSGTIPGLYTWTHIAAVRYSTTFTIYVNGSSIYTTASFVNPSGSTGTLYIGTYFANYNNDGSYFRGYISNLRISKVAVYTGAFTPPSSPLTSTQSSGTNIAAITTQTQLLTLQTIPGTPLSWTQVVSGYDHATAIRNDSTIWAWGNNNVGQLGTGDTITRSSPIQIGTSSWTQVSAGQSHTVAIRSDNTLWSWGLNNVAQLGYGDTLNRSSPAQVGSFNSWTQVRAGVSTTSGVMSNYLFTWGLNTTGQLGLNNSTNKNFPILVSAALPVDVSTNALTAPLTITAGPVMTYMSPFATGQYNIATYGGSMFMTTSSDGIIASSSNFAINASAFSIECWVYFFTGSNGNVFSTYVQLSSPGDHGTIFSFGTNGVVSILLKLNNSNVYSQSTTNTMNLNAWNHILVARNSSGTISMYINGTRGFTGSNTYSVGETTLGTGVGYAATNITGALLGLISNLRFCIGTIPYDPTLATITVPTTPLTAVTGTQWLIAQGLGSTFTSHTQVTSNSTTGLAIRGDGSLWAWGNNPAGQFGNNKVVAQSSPVQVGLNILTSTTAPSIIPTKQSWNVISAGQSYSLAIRSDNTLWAWGLNSSTQLGLGDTLVRSSPTQVGVLNSWISVSANYATSAGIQNTWLHTWGLGTTGQLGTGDATTKGIPILSGTPAPIDASSNAYTISIGGTPKMTDMTPFATGTYNTVTYGGSMYFNGANSDNLLVGSAPAVGAGGFSVEAFIYYYQGSSGYFYSNYVQLSSPGDHGVYLYLGTNGTLFTQLKLNNGSVFQLTTTNSCNLNAWNHVLLIRDASGNTSLYINGVRGATGTNTYNQGEGGYSIGSYYYGQSGSFTGLISNLRFIVGSTLPYSATVATITVPTTPLTAVTGTALLTLQTIGVNYQSFSKVSVGSSYVTANRNDGAFLAWGYNAYGQLGVIDTINRSSPTLVAGYNTPQQITNSSIWNTVSAGFSYTMGIQSNGTLWAWGLNTLGQLGTGDTLSRVSITQVGAGSWLQISAGNYTGSNTTYGIATNFILYAWGNNNVGQVLDGTTINKSSPVQVGTSSWTSVSAGASTGGAILSNGVVYNWGLGTNGTIGNNTVNTYSSPVVLGNIPASNTTYPNKIVTAQSWSLVTASYSTSYAIRADKTLWSWGINASGQLGVNNAVTYSSPVQVGTSSWTQISTTNSTVGAIRSDYTLWMWGYNGQGQLGNNTTVTYSSPIQIGASWLAVSVGYNTTLAISNTSQLYVWGQSTNGELGNNTIVNLSSPVQLGTRSWTSLGAGGNTSAAVRNDGLLFLWGLNTSGQLGDLTVVSKSSPVILGNVIAGASSPIQIQSSGTFNSWISVTAGTNYTLGIDTAYRLWVWGFNNVGQLGDGTTDSKYSPVLMSSNSWLSLSAGVSHTLAIDFTNSLYAWGLNSSGQLGTGTTINYSSPVQVAGPASYQKISAGNSASAAISMNNNLYSWGNNSTAMLGTGDTINRSSPTLIGTSFNQVSVGGSATVATLINRTMYTWGTNASGVLAQNNTISYSSPVLVGPFSFVSFSSPVQVGSLSWISVASGLSHMAAVRSDGLLFAWGVNTGGQLGNNTAISYSSPIQIGTSSWTQVAAGQSHTLAIRSDKTLWGWGLNSTGQLGNSSVVTYSSPVQIGASLNTSWSLVTAGASHTVVIDTNKILWAWGNNAYGQLGTRDAVNRSGPTQVNITTDASVNNFVLTRFGNNYMTNSLTPFAVPGANTNSGFFDGVSAYLTVPTSNSITFGSGSFTIEFWMYSTSTTNSRMFGNIPSGAFAANQWVIAFNYTVANTVSLVVYNFSSSTPIVISSATNLNNGAWHHVAIVRNIATFTMFVDGTPSGTGTYSGVIDAGLSNPLVIGTTGATGDTLYSGYLSNLRVVKGLVVYTGAFTVPTSSLSITQNSGTNISAITGTQTSLLTLQNLGANVSWNSVGSGQNHTIALDSSSHIWGWGLNSAYQVGDNTLINRSSPVLVSSLSSWTQVTAGTDHSIAIGADGSMWVWGNNNQGQLGLGNGTNVWKQVVEGQSFTAGISSSGQLFTWGYNNVGQLGTGDTFNRSSPVLLGTSTSWTNIIAGASHLAAIDASGNLWMWGNNATGQLGDGTYINKSSPVLVASSILAVGTGTDHTLALNSAGKLFGWGNNSSGQTAAYTIPYSWTVISESSTGSHTVAIRSDSTLWTWGLNSSGQLGIGNTINQSSPIQVGTSSWTAISVGASHTMAINGFGLLYGWGNNSLYQVGDGTSINKSIPVQIGTSSWTAVSAGQNHTLAITSTFLLYAWGQGTTGQLGTLTTTYSWTALSAGATHATAIRGDGTTWTWGRNTSGQLGTLTIITYSSPVQVGTSFVKISSGNNHSLAINNIGALFGWGINGTYQLGTGDILSRSSPVQISTSSFSLVSAGYSYSGAISSTGALYMWGLGTGGQLGYSNYFTGTLISPTSITTFVSWTQLSLGYDHVAGIDTLGRLYTWGTASSIGLYVQPQSWASISSGKSGYHVLAIRSDNTLWSWGSNSVGQLGTGDILTRSSPVQVGMLMNNWASISAGDSHSIAINSNNRIYAWGLNSSGQLGDGSTINKPVAVLAGVTNAQTDASTYNYAVNVYSGSPRITEFSPFATFNSTGNSVYFNGTYSVDGYQVPTGVNFQFTTGVAFTIEAWVYLVPASAGYRAIFDSRTTVNNITGLFIGLNNSTNAWTIAYTGGGNFVIVTTNLNYYQWQHIAVVRNTSNVMTAYLNGVNVGSATVTQTFTDGGCLIGRTIDGVPWNGYISNFRIVNGLAVYTGNFTVPTTPLTATQSAGVNISAITNQTVLLTCQTLGSNQYSWTQVTAGTSYSVARRSDSTLWAWGLNSVYQLGIGTTINQSSPIQIGTSSWSQVNAGHDHVLAIDSSTSNLWTWGNANSTFVLTTPASWSQLSAGASHVLAIRNDNTLWSWGYNLTGQLGDGTSISKSSPVQVVSTPSKSWNSVYAGDSHSVAIDSNNLMYAWGLNASGQLGLLTNTSTKIAPVLVNGTVATDASINNYTLTNVGASMTNFSPFTSPGTTGFSGVFNGSSDYYLLPAGASSTTAAAGAFTIEAWVYSTAATGNAPTIASSWYNGSASLCSWVFNISATNTITFSYGIGSTNSGFTGTSQFVLQNSWYHVAIVRNSSNLVTLYVNGVADITTATIAGTLNTNSNGPKIGSQDNSSHGWLLGWQGYISNFRFVNGTAVYTSNFTPSITPLTATQSANVNGSPSAAIASGTAILTMQNLVAPQSWSQVTAGASYTMARRSDSTMWGWGINNVYQLGIGDALSRSSPVQIGTSSWYQVSAGFDHTLAIDSTTRNIYTWGNINSVYGFTTNYSWTQVATSGNHSLAIRSDGSLWTWGLNSAGQLGNGATINQSSPVQVGTSSWSQIYAGDSHTVGITITNYMYAWGLNASGQLGNGTTVNQSVPAQIGLIGTSSWTQVTAGVSFTMARRSDSTLWAWGLNSVYQLGIGTTINQSSPIQIGTSSWSFVSAGVDHSVAIDTITSNIWTWGNVNSVFTLTTPYSWTQVSEGLSHTLAIRSDSTLWAWGYNANGQLGDGTSISKSSPVQVGTSSWASVAAGDLHSVGISATTKLLFAWGNNATGQLGDGTSISKSSPIQIGTSSWTSVSAGLSYTLGITVSPAYKMYTWGVNSSGQLGDGTSINKSSPVQVGTSSWTQVSASKNNSFVLAISSANLLYGWGVNGSGQLGTNNTITYSSPVQIGTSSWSQVAAGFDHTVAITFTNQLFAWGTNASGQLGQNNTLNYSSPMLVASANSNAPSDASGTNTIISKFGNTYLTGSTTPFGTLVTNGYSQYFDGGSYLSGTLTTPTSATAFTIEAWVYLTGYPGSPGGGIMGTSYTASTPYGWYLNVRNTGYVSFNETWGASGFASTNVVPLNQWVHIAATRNGATATIYINGVPNGTGTFSQTYTSTQFVIGRDYVGSSIEYFGGYISNLRYVNNVVVYTGSFTPPSSPLTSTQSSGTNISTITSGQTQLLTLQNIGTIQSWSQVSAGTSTTYAVRSDNTLWAWGLNSTGQLGQTFITISMSSPVQIGTSSWTQISVASSTVTAISSTNQLFAWGNNATGQLGTNDILSRSSPTQVRNLIIASSTPVIIPTSQSWLAVSAGNSFATAIRNDNTLWTWGLNNAAYQLGLGDTLNRYSPSQIGSLNSWTQVKAGISFASGIMNNYLFNWGLATTGQGGNYVTVASMPVPMIEGANLPIDTSAYNNTFTVAGGGGRMTYMSPFATGQYNIASYGGSGIFGANGAYMATSHPLLNISAANSIWMFETWVFPTPSTTYFIAIGSGGAFGNSIFSGWGSNTFTFAQGTGSSNINNLSSPSIYPPGNWYHYAVSKDATGFIRLFINGNYVAGVLNPTNAVAGGTTLVLNGVYDNNGLGNSGGVVVLSNMRVVIGNPVYTVSFTPPTGPLTATQSTNVNGSPSAAITAGQTVILTLQGLTGQTNWNQVSTLYSTTVGISSTGQLYAWGNNATGQVGDNSTVTRSSPVQVRSSIIASSTPVIIPTSQSWNIVSAGISYSAAIRNDNTLWMWGQNTVGQLGVSAYGYYDTNARSSPSQVPGSYTSVKAGNSYTYAVSSSGSLFTWGYNGQGQLGNSTTVNYSSPVQIGTLSWTQIGTTLYSSPTQIGTTSWSSVGAGIAGQFGIVIRSDGALFGWGNNTTYGQLGTNNTISQSSPVQVRGLVSVISQPTQISTGQSWLQVSAGVSHSGAINSSNILWLWGLNNAGQLATGDTLNRSQPTQLGVSSWTSVTAGNSFTLGIQSGNVPFAWGLNSSAQLSDYTVVNKSSPVNVGTVITLSNQNAFGYTTAASTYGGWPISNTSTLNFAAGQAFTVEMWVYPTIASNGTYFFNWGTYKSAYTSEYVMNIGYTGANIYISNGSNTSTTGYSISYPSSVTLSANTWYHIALVRTSSSVATLYLNGVGGTPVTVSGAAQPLSARYDLAGPNGMWFGVNITNWTAFSPTTYTGYISNFRYVLGNAVYTGNFTVPTSPLTATQSSGTNINAITAGQTQLLTFDALALTQITADSVAFVQISGLFSTSNSVLTYTPSSFTGITLINGSLFYGTQVATGVSTGYAVSSSSGSIGTLFGWGVNNSYQLGLNNSATTYSSPIQIGNYQYLNTGTLAPAQIQGSWSAVSAGQSFTLAITNTGTLYGWGLNTSGQLGTSDVANRSSPTQISTLSWSSVSAGYSHAGAITSVNTLYMWGSGGVTPAINTSSPTQITSGSNSWSQVSAGQSYTLARDINGLLYGWGQDSSGQLGIL